MLNIKAINILTDHITSNEHSINPDLKTAQLMSIQALIRHGRRHGLTLIEMRQPIPGETIVS